MGNLISKSIFVNVILEYILFIQRLERNEKLIRNFWKIDKYSFGKKEGGWYEKKKGYFILFSKSKNVNR